MILESGKLYNELKALLIALYLLLGVLSIIEKSPTSDEPLHLVDGIAYYKFKNFKFDIEHPPLARLWAGLVSFAVKVNLPPKEELIKTDFGISVSGWSPINDFSYARKTLYFMKNKSDLLFFGGRLLILALGIPLIIVLAQWSKELYGYEGSLITLTLICLSPNILAHARLVTTDFASISLAVIASFFLWKFVRAPNINNFLPSVFLWGFALATKYTSLFYFLAFHLVAVILCGNRKKFILFFFLQIPIIIFIINLCYFFTEPVCGNFLTSKDLQIFPQFSRPIIAFAAKYSFLPRIYINGLIYSFSHSVRGHTAYLFGALSDKGWWYYFPAAFIIKSTITTLSLAAFSLISIKKKSFSRNELFFVIPSFLFMLFMMHSNLNIGIRHILILWPFVFLFAGRVASLIKRKFLPLILIAALFENLIIFPHYISHFNILFGGAKNGWKYLADSNIDWGQDLKLLSKWWKKEGEPPLILSYAGIAAPEYYGIKYQSCFTYQLIPADNTVTADERGREFLAVSIMHLLGIPFGSRNLFLYFMGKRPVKRCGYSIYVYDIGRDAEAHLVLGAMYRMHNKFSLMKNEFSKSFILDPSVLGTVPNEQTQ